MSEFVKIKEDEFINLVKVDSIRLQVEKRADPDRAGEEIWYWLFYLNGESIKGRSFKSEKEARDWFTIHVKHKEM